MIEKYTGILVVMDKTNILPVIPRKEINDDNNDNNYRSQKEINNTTNAKEEEEEEEPEEQQEVVWTDKELKVLNGACSRINRDFNWSHVAALVGTKTADQCQNKYTSRFETPVKKRKKEEEKDISLSPFSMERSKMRTLKTMKKLRVFTEKTSSTSTGQKMPLYYEDAMPMYSLTGVCVTSFYVALNGSGWTFKGVEVPMTVVPYTATNGRLIWGDQDVYRIKFNFTSTTKSLSVVITPPPEATSDPYVQTLTNLDCQAEYPPYEIYGITALEEAFNSIYFTFKTNSTSPNQLFKVKALSDCYYTAVLTSVIQHKHILHRVRLTISTAQCDMTQPTTLTIWRSGELLSAGKNMTLYPLFNAASKAIIHPTVTFPEANTITNVSELERVALMNTLTRIDNSVNTIVCAQKSYSIPVLCSSLLTPVSGNRSTGLFWFGEVFTKNEPSSPAILAAVYQIGLSNSLANKFQFQYINTPGASRTNNPPSTVVHGLFNFTEHILLPLDNHPRIVQVPRLEASTNTANYPFGFTSGTFKIITIKTTLLIPNTQSLTTEFIPVLSKREIKPFGGFNFIYTLEFTATELGLSELKLDSGAVIGDESIIKYNRSNPSRPVITYQFEAPMTSSLDVTHFKSINILRIPFLDFHTDFVNKISPFDSFNYATLDDFTFFSFAMNTLNVTDKPASNVLYFNITNADRSIRPKLYLPQTFNGFDPTSAVEVSASSDMFQGRWSDSLQLFVIEFTVKKNLFEGPLQYILMAPIFTNCAEFISVFGNPARLNLISQYADLLPPLLVEVTAFPGTSVQRDEIELIGWDVTVEDLRNGLDYGYIEVMSDYDPEPTRVYLDDSTRISGDIYTGTYSVRFTPPSTSQTQSYSMYAYLKDTAGHYSQREEKRSMDPLFKLSPDQIEQTTIIVNYPDTNDVTAPVLTFFNVSAKEIDVGADPHLRTVTFTYGVEDDQVGVFDKNLPYVYIYGFRSYSGCKSTIVSCTASQYLDFAINTSCTYQCTIEIAYGFGHLDTLAIAIHGIYDNNLNTIGYTASDLEKAGFQATITRSFTINIGNIIHVKGVDLAYFTSVAVVLNIPAKLKEFNGFQVKFKVGDKESTSILKVEYTIDIEVDVCPGSPLNICNSKGTCFEGVCSCFEGFLAPDWTTQINCTLQEYSTMTNVPFAGVDLFMTPQSVKYTISMSPYIFQAPTNTLELIIKVRVDGNTSMVTCKSNDMGESDNLFWIRFQLGNSSLYGRFLSRAICDSRHISITNKLVETSNAKETLLSISIPRYMEKMTIDPDLTTHAYIETYVTPGCSSEIFFRPFGDLPQMSRDHSFRSDFALL
eukprot:gene14577-17234_t